MKRSQTVENAQMTIETLMESSGKVNAERQDSGKNSRFIHVHISILSFLKRERERNVETILQMFQTCTA